MICAVISQKVRIGCDRVRHELVSRCSYLVSSPPSGERTKANLYPQIKRGDLVRIIHWLISIIKRPWNRADVSKKSANEDYEDTYYLLNYRDKAVWHSYGLPER